MREYTDYEMKKMKEIELEILEKFKQICLKYHLSYFAIGGTAIGAVRHGGFIPWDDDIDFGMFREDYEKFLEVVEEECEGKYELISASIQKNVCGHFGQLCKIGTTFTTPGNVKWPYHPGIKIDIFPYDCIPNSRKLLQKQIRTGKFWNRLYILKVIPCPEVNLSGLKKYLVSFVCNVVHILLKPVSVDFLVKQYMKNSRKYDGASDYYTCLDDIEPQKWILRKKDVFPLKEIPFENTTILVANKNHEILTKWYGDYMKIPKESERVNHDIVRLDFGENA